MLPLFLALAANAADPDTWDRAAVDHMVFQWVDTAGGAHNGAATAGVSGVARAEQAAARGSVSVTAKRIRLGAWVPVDRTSEFFGGAGADLRVTLADRPVSPIGVAISGRTWRPRTRSIEGGGWSAGAILEHGIGGVRYALNVGISDLGEADPYSGIDEGVLPYGRFGIQVGANAKTGVSLEAGTRFRETTAVDLLGGIGFGRVTRITLSAGAKVGDGVARPGGMLTMSRGPKHDLRDYDVDGVVDKFDQCPTQAEDLDGYDDEDGCPDIVRIDVIALDEDGNRIPAAEWAMHGSFGQAPGGTFVEQGHMALRVWAPRYEARTVVLDSSGGGALRKTVVLHPLEASGLVQDSEALASID
jgi:hypothetical protein